MASQVLVAKEVLEKGITVTYDVLTPPLKNLGTRTFASFHSLSISVELGSKTTAIATSNNVQDTTSIRAPATLTIEHGVITMNFRRRLLIIC
jgi:hypothetical protein